MYERQCAARDRCAWLPYVQDGAVMTGASELAGRTLLFVVTEDWYFVSHRLPLARRALAAGMKVAIATNVAKHGDLIRDAGITVYPWRVVRSSSNPWGELQSVLRLWQIYRAVRPDTVHHVAIKPVLYGSFVAKLTGVTRVVNALGGLGFLFAGGASRNRLSRHAVLAGFRWLLAGGNSRVILQNPDDRDLLVAGAGIRPERVRLIRGAGVDVAVYNDSPEPPGDLLVILPARMLSDKGVHEFVAAAGRLKGQGVRARFALVGGEDPGNPASIPTRQLEEWEASGAVEWFGRRDDMPAVFAMAAIVCLPSYREGLPKSLLEAAACGRPIVTTDVPGCREIVLHGENGFLVPARDSEALAQSLGTLLNDAGLRRRMGRKGREMVLREFSEETVVAATLAIYE